MALHKTTIVKEALALLQEGGLEGVSLRKLAARLDVQAPALYWHFKNKAVLVNEMADAILQTQFATFAPRKIDETWAAWLMNMMQRLRKTMLSHTDGARVIAGAHLSTTMLAFSESTINTLVEAGVALREARLIVLTATRYTFGYVIEEQTPMPPEGSVKIDMEAFKTNYPTVIAGIEDYFSSGRTIDDLFNDGLKLIIRD
ncbi:TetR/AcrR family transcriptional regulator C-terminal domain-containing protein [Cohnella sp. 56]|uniref:TetR/AcrR family transcriptional regulator C-terminal domain-containing protein n=1 Tax=Cohnella sp. 56 TaxID=3113722 RepID=UPI0030EA3F22